MLKNSARNCTLKVSEILGTWVFLNTEKSTVLSPGPYKLFRPGLPTRFAQVPAIPGLPAGLAALGVRAPKDPHWAAIAGVASGRAKHCALRYWTPPWIGLHPDTRFAKSMEKSPLNPVPSGSPPPPIVGVKGDPVVAVTIAPSSQPPARYPAVPVFGPG